MTTFAARRKQVAAALARARVRHAFRFPQQRSGVLVIDLDPAPDNLARARVALGALPEPWPRFAAWLADPVGGERRDGDVLVATALAAAARATADTDEAALLAAVAAAPDDDAPRLVFADLLSSRGDPRGELIALQCRLAAARPRDGDGDGDRDRDGDGDGDAAVRARVDALLAAGWRAYAGELGPYASARAFERGFVQRVLMTVAAFAKHGERILDTHPARALVIANPRLTARDLAKLAATPALARIRELVIRQSPMRATRDALAPLASSRYLGGLEHLVLGGCGHSAADWARLFELDAPALATIRLAWTHGSAAIPAAIARNPALAKLRRLSVDNTHSLDRRDAVRRARDAYEQLAARVALRQLAIDHDHAIEDGAIAAFFASDAAASLSTLELTGTRITGSLLRTIARSPKAATLERLSVHGGGTLAGAADLLASPHTGALRDLAITSYDWSEADRATYERLLLAVPASHPLRRVSLPGNAPGSAALRERFEVR